MKKRMFRILLLATTVAAGFGVTGMTGAKADNLCHDEYYPYDTSVDVGSTAAVGVDTGLTGMTYVPVACVRVGATSYGGGAGATITPTPSGYRIQPKTCDTHSCSDFLISVG